MKNFFKSLVVGALVLASVGCSDMFKEDLYEINNEIDKINARIDSLCNAVNTNIASLQTIIDVMQDNDYVDSIVPIVEGGVTVGYEITFTQSGSVKIYHGKKGETGATGHTPIVGVKQAEDGRWYWTVDGEYLLDAEGDKILAEAIDGEDGATGADGITPQLEVRDNYWYISYDNGATWVQLGKATGEAGKDGDSMFKSVNYNDEYVELVLVDGTVLRIPTWASHMLLVDEIAKINSNISAIQAAVRALESNDYVQKVTPVKDEDGNVIGYTLQFAFTGDVTIYHGEDGKDGEDGEDGKDGEDGEDGKDGYTPVIGARQHPDGYWYWTVDGEWLLDTNGNRVKTTGEDGADGTVGITPELKIEDDYWYVSYDNKATWERLGKAKGEDGAAGGDGAAGDAFFKGVNVTEDYVTFTLADGTEIKIPTWKVYQELADAVAHLNTNVQSMQTIIAAIQNNDFVTGTSEIVDPQTNEVIGYKLHFSKSGDIEIYHGTTPNAPEIGIKKHPQYGLCWTYNGDYIKDPSTGAPVALPKDGASGVTPQFKIVDGMWFVSMDEGRTWQEAGQATGDQGETGATGGAGDSFFKSVKEEKVKDANGNDVVAYIVMTLADGSEYRVPTAYITDELTKRIAAIENQFSIISTIVNALQSAEYIKEVVELYEGPALVGYEITFVKYAIGADGKLTETTRKSTIRNGGAGEAGTVVAAEYDAATDTWYWTLDGVPLKDKDGNYVAINGKDGKPGATPQMQINDETNFWEVSYDGGKTWESTGVKATGPQGNPGQGGAAGDSFFADVYKEGDYWVFERVGGDKIEVPTAEAFASLAAKVAALEETSKSIMNLVNGKKYIESCEPFDNETGTGYHLVLVSVDPQTGETVKEDCYIYDGKDGVTPVVGLRQDADTGDWYWTVDGKDVLVDGKPVKANGPQGIDGPVPSFRIDPSDGHLYVTINGTETDLGRVVGANGSAGESGTNSSIDVTTAEDGKVTITFIGGDGLTSTIEVPSWAAFVELQEMVNDLNANVEALQAAVTALQNNDYVIAVEDVTGEAGEVVGYKLVFAKSGEKIIYHGKKGDKGEDAVAPTISINEDGFWVINGEATDVKAAGDKGETGESGKTPKFKIVSGDWYYSYDMDNVNDDDIEGWTYAGRATGSGGEAGDAFFKSVSPVGSDQATAVPAAEAYYISIELIDGSKYLVPTSKTTDELFRLADQLNSNVEALQTALNAISGCQHVISYTKFQENGKDAGYKLTLTDGPDEDAENDVLYIYFGKDGANGVTPTVTINEEGYWVINGEPTTYKAVPENGQPGATPLFKIVNGDWYYSYEKDNVNDTDTEGWTYAGRATGPQGDGGQQGDSFFKAVTYEYAKAADGSTLKDNTGKDIIAYIVLTLSDDTQHKIPTEWVITQLEARIEALESQFSALQTIVNAINEHEYVKKIVGVYEGLALTGYRITFVTYSVAADGSLQESETEKLINFETTANIPVVGAEQDEQTGVWYWTIDGERIKGADGKDVPMQGPQGPEGQPGHTPVITIGENGNWFIDGVDTGKPSQGVQGETGGSGDSFFKSVQYKDNNNNVVTDPTAAYYIEFTLANNDVIKVPTASAFESLITKLGQLEIKVNGLQDAINLQNDALESLTGTYEDFVAGLETKRFAGVPVYNEETQSWVFSVVDGLGNTVEGAGFSIVQGNVVTIVKDDEDGKYYWAIDGVKTDYPVTGNDGQPAPKPEFQINLETGELEYRFEGEGDDAWQPIGDVVGEDGEPGAPGTNGATNVVFASAVQFDENGAYVSYTEESSADAALWVGVQYGTGEKDFIWMPTYKNFQAIEERLETVEDEVDDIQGSITEINGSLASLSEKITALEGVQGNYLTSAEFQAWKNDARFVQNVTKNGDVWSFVVADGNGNAIEDAGFVITATPDVSTYEKDGVLYWVINGEETEYPVETKPKFQVDASGRLQFSMNGTDWTTLESASNAVKVVFTNDPAPAGGTWVAVDAADALWAGIYYSEDNIIWMPTYKNFQDIEARLESVVNEVAAIQGSITTINGSLASLSDQISALEAVQGNYLTSAEFKTWKENARFVQSVTKNGDEWTFVVADGNGTPVNDAAFTVSVDHPISVTTKENGDLYWVINGKEYPVESKPKFQIDPQSGNLQFSIDGSDWTTLESASNAVKVVFTNDPAPAEGTWVAVDAADALWAGIHYSEENIIWMPTYLNFKNIEGRLDKVEGDVVAIQGSITTINGSLASLSEKIAALEGVQGNYLTSAEFQAWKDGARFVQNVTKNGDVWSFVVADGNGNAIEDAGFAITATTDVSTYEKDGVLYWVINGEETEYPVETKPKFQVDASGRLQFSMNGTDWTTLESASNAVKVVFTNDPAPAEGTWVAVDAADAADALWAGIYYGEDNIIWMPTYKNFQALAGRVSAVEGRVTALEEFVELHRTSIESLVTLSTDVNGLIEDVDKLKTYKFIGTPVQTETGWKIPVVNGAGQTVEGEEIILTNGTDGSVVTIDKPEGSEDYYWFIDGENTGHKVTGNNGQPAPKPEFNITGTGELVYRFEGEGDDAWKSIGDVVGEPGANGATNVIFASVVNEDGTFTKVEDASQANWVGIIFVEGENADSYDDDQIIWVPTYRNFQGLQALVTTLNTNANSLAELIEGKRFITAIDPNWKETIDNIERTGTKITYIEIINGTPSEPKFMYIYNGLAGANGADGVTVGVKTWTAEDGEEGEVGKLYWTITQNNQTNWLRNGENLVPATGPQGKDGYSPKFKIVEGTLYYSYDKDNVSDEETEGWTVIGKVTGENGTDAVVDIDDTNANYYVIRYTIGDSVEEITVPKWIDASDVSVTFNPTTLNLGTDDEGTVTCTIDGSFTSAPDITVSCEGLYVSEIQGTPTTNADGAYQYTIKVTKTVSYAGATMSGKLTVMVPYYGTSIVKQLPITATSPSLEVQNINAGKTSLTYSVGNISDDKKKIKFIFEPEIDKLSWVTGISYDENDNPVINLLANTTTEARECTITALLPNGRILDKRTINQLGYDDKDDNASGDAITDLAELESANCYIISAGGTYMLPTVKGNTTTPINGIAGVPEVIWSDNANGFEFVSATNDHIVFRVGATSLGILDLSYINNGNMVVGVKDANGNILWSWHLWFTTSLPGTQTYPHATLGEGTAGEEVMDRALGASLISGGDGLYYQWGRKDPFRVINNSISNLSENGTYDNATRNPEIFYTKWSSEEGRGWKGKEETQKTINDPCPPGYKVPASNVWMDNAPNKDNSTSVRFTYSTTYATTTDEIYYPYTSYIENGSLIIKDKTPITQNGSTTLYSREVSLGSYTIRLKYSGTTSTSLGMLWGTDKSIYYDSQTFQIDDSYTIEYKSGSSWKALSNLITNILNRLGLNDIVTGILGEAKAGVNNFYKVDITENNINNGLQVRCVMEEVKE